MLQSLGRWGARPKNDRPKSGHVHNGIRGLTRRNGQLTILGFSQYALSLWLTGGFRRQSTQPPNTGFVGSVTTPSGIRRNEQARFDPRHSIGMISQILAKQAAATIGPMVCELDGPMPTLNRSKTPIYTVSPAAQSSLP